jgi:anti-sigma regulatory factor (Ser/Thr protein kinase)
VLVQLAPLPESVHQARQAVSTAFAELGRDDLVDDAEIVASELVANAVMHARTQITLSVERSGVGIRLSVADGSDKLPRWTPVQPTATSGRGLLLVQRLSGTWGVEPLGDSGKVVWAQLDQPAAATAEDVDGDLLDLWEAEPWPSQGLRDAGIEVAVDIDVQAMLDSRAHTDDLVRDLQLTLLDSASESRPGVVALAGQLQRANEEFYEPRRQMYNQTISAARHRNSRTTLHLMLRQPEADAATRWLAALDEADALTASGVLLVPPFPPELTAFRRQYIGAIVEQVRAGGRDDTAP